MSKSPLSYLSPKTAVKKSPIHGKGLFAIKPIRKGEIVAIKGGYIFDEETLDEKEDVIGDSYIQIADNFYIGDLNRKEIAGCMIYSNHSCDPNIGIRGQIVFAALRDIKKGEELTHDWAMTDNEPYKMKCNCGATNCRGIVTGKDWRKKELQRKYRGFFSDYLQRKITPKRKIS